MSTITLEQATSTFGVDVEDHHDRDALVPVLAGIQFQGDVAVVPTGHANATTLVPHQGVPVVRGESGGNTHLLLADGDVAFDPAPQTDPTALLLGTLTVPDGATAYLAHPEHAYSGIAPGSYELRRQREQADEIRLVQD